MKLSDLDLDIPSDESFEIRKNLKRSCIKNANSVTPHPAGVYFYKSIPSFNGFSVLDYKEMESKEYQKVDILNNNFLNNISIDKFYEYLDLINSETIDWKKLWEFENPYQLSNYPFILREFKVQSVIDIAIVLAIIRPGALQNYDKMKSYIHTEKLLKNKTEKQKEILKDTYGIAVFDEQFKKLENDNGKYKYKKPHAIGYAYVLLIDFLKNIEKK